jgi:drug/metabolite transporter (DMT)-like permease
LLLLGLQHTNADAAGIITSALPAMVAFFSIIFLKERLTFHTTFCIVFAIVGLIIVNAHALPTNRQNHFFGDMIILCSLVPEAAYYILSKMHQNKLPVFLVSALMNGINIPIFLLFFLAQSQATPLGLLFDNLLLLMIVGIGSALFYVFWFLGCKNVHGTAAGLTTAFMPVSTLTMAYLFLDEKISPTQMIGMLFIIFSIFSNVLQKSKHQTIKTVP